MHIAVVTLFPEMFSAITEYGVSGRAVKDGLLQVACFNPRSFTSDRHQTVDDRPYGGGPGMVMLCEPLLAAVNAAKDWIGEKDTKVVYMSPQGVSFTHKQVKEHALPEQNLILVAGRYEGVDERFIELAVDEEWTIGDYVLSGGELPAMVVMDALIRHLPGALGHNDSAVQDSFVEGILDCPHYTRPETFSGRKVPEVLLSGDHKRIAQWRKKQAEERTRKRRPDLLN
jgi:tRNA (guanine37-N1)-methyltransferase